MPLCRKVGGGRIAALEVLLTNNAVANLIRDGKTFQLPSVLQTSKAQGMVLLNDSLLDLVKRGLVEPREAALDFGSPTRIDTATPHSDRPAVDDHLDFRVFEPNDRSADRGGDQATSLTCRQHRQCGLLQSGVEHGRWHHLARRRHRE